MNNTDKTINKVAILMAMQEEANGTIAALSMKKCFSLLDERLKLNVYRSIIKNAEVFLITNGFSQMHKGICRVGTQPAALSAWETIRVLKPDLIISAGTAGGLNKKDGKIGDVFLSDKKIYFHDRRIPLGEYQSYGRGAYPCLDLSLLAKQLKIRICTISTGNSLNCGVNDLAELQHLNADLKDMEAAAIADVAQLCGVDFTAIKAITDMVDIDANAPSEFSKNLSFATEKLTLKLVELIHIILMQKSL